MFRMFYSIAVILLVLMDIRWCEGHHADAELEVHSRQKRTIYFNTHTPVYIGIAFALPLSFALPTFQLKSDKVKRSISGDYHVMDDNDILPVDSYDEPAYYLELRKLLQYFAMLEIEEDICQQRFICEIFSEDDKFRPISNIFMPKLIVDRGPIPEKRASRYYRFVKAMQEGVVFGASACPKEFGKCPYSAEERLNMPALQSWAYLNSVLGIEIHDV